MIRTGAELASACVDVARNYKTVYVLGSFGWQMSYENQQRALRSYAFNAGLERSRVIRAASKDTFGFDCICLIKALLWGWCGDESKPYGGAAYNSNGVPDLDETAMLGVCKEVSDDFTGIEVGEYLWTDGHCGIYVGSGKAAECTYRWSDGVQETSVYNITGETGSKGRYWKKHGKLPFISYENAADECYSIKLPELSKGMKGESVRSLQILLIGNGFSCGGTGADGDFGNNTRAAVIGYQKKHGLAADGIAGVKTMSRLLGVAK